MHAIKNDLLMGQCTQSNGGRKFLGMVHVPYRMDLIPHLLHLGWIRVKRFQSAASFMGTFLKSEFQEAFWVCQVGNKNRALVHLKDSKTICRTLKFFFIRLLFEDHDRITQIMMSCFAHTLRLHQGVGEVGPLLP